MSKTNPEKANNKRNKPTGGAPKPANKVRAKKVKTIDAEKDEQSNTKLKAKSPAAATGEINTKSQTPDTQMEVHHHPQLEHKHKPWKEYILEGFMIFIAVMMGFIAENIREAVDNNEHVKQLTSLLVQDMKADLAKLDTIHMQEALILKSNDTLFSLLQQPLTSLDTRKIQRLAISSHSVWLFHPIGGAIGAIKNELHLKQFSNSKIISLIARYEEHIELVRTVQDITLQYQRSYLDPFLLQHFTPGNLAAAFNFSTIPNGQMRNLTQNDLSQLAADMALIRINTKELLLDNERLKRDATNLLVYVKKQYGVEDE